MDNLHSPNARFGDGDKPPAPGPQCFPTSVLGEHSVAEPCAGWRAEQRGLGLELTAFGPLCNAGQLEGFTFQRGKENMKN